MEERKRIKFSDRLNMAEDEDDLFAQLDMDVGKWQLLH